jgi:hypothetical protein
MKIVSSKKSAQMIVCYFIIDTLPLAERWCSHHPRTSCCPMLQNFVAIQSTKYGLKHMVLDMNRDGRTSLDGSLWTKIVK